MHLYSHASYATTHFLCISCILCIPAFYAFPCTTCIHALCIMHTTYAFLCISCIHVFHAFPWIRCSIHIMHPCIFTSMHSCNLCMLCISCDDAFYAFPMHLVHTCIMQPCVHASHEYMHYASKHSNMHAFYTTMHFMHLMHSRIYAYTHFHAPDACIAHLCISCMTRLPCTSVEVSPWATGSSLWSRRALHPYWSSGYGRHVNAAFILAPDRIYRCRCFP